MCVSIFLSFTSKGTSVISWDIDVLLHEVDAHNHHITSQYNEKREFSEDPNGIAASPQSVTATNEKPTVFPGVMIGHGTWIRK
jgi:hypothetical protein